MTDSNAEADSIFAESYIVWCNFTLVMHVYSFDVYIPTLINVLLLLDLKY